MSLWDSSVIDSSCGNYRYWTAISLITRRASYNVRVKDKDCIFIVLHPTDTVVSVDSDNTQQSIRLAAKQGYQRLGIINLFAYSTSLPLGFCVSNMPKFDIVGPKNNIYLGLAAAQDADIVCAWGATYKFSEPDKNLENTIDERVGYVLSVLRAASCKLWCFHSLPGELPPHPKYTNVMTPLVEYNS